MIKLDKNNELVPDHRPPSSEWLPNTTKGIAATDIAGVKVWRPVCNHYPYKIVEGKDFSLSLTEKFLLPRTFNKYELYINCTGLSSIPRHKLPEPLKKYRVAQEEIVLDWRDGAAIEFDAQFWIDLANYIRQNKMNALLFCSAGHGRTGTAAACLIMVLCDKTAREAIKWVRKNYCSLAIENLTQEEYIKLIGKQLNKLNTGKKK
jgi:Swiss Army Knife protein, DSP-PTPase phosphatase domain